MATPAIIDAPSKNVVVIDTADDAPLISDEDNEPQGALRFTGFINGVFYILMVVVLNDKKTRLEAQTMYPLWQILALVAPGAIISALLTSFSVVERYVGNFKRTENRTYMSLELNKITAMLAFSMDPSTFKLAIVLQFVRVVVFYINVVHGWFVVESVAHLAMTFSAGVYILFYKGVVPDTLVGGAACLLLGILLEMCERKRPPKKENALKHKVCVCFWMNALYTLMLFGRLLSL